MARNIGAFRVKTNLASNPGSQFTNRVTLEKSPGISLDFKIHLQNEGATHRMCGKIKQGNDCEESTTVPGTQPLFSKWQLSKCLYWKRLQIIWSNR